VLVIGAGGALVSHPDLTAESVVLREGGVLMDVSMRPAAAARRLREETTGAPGTVVLNAGRTRGVSNLVAADLLAAHPDADAVEVAFSFSAGTLVLVEALLDLARRDRVAPAAFDPPRSCSPRPSWSRTSGNAASRW
jgi:hypothetical protein